MSEAKKRVLVVDDEDRNRRLLVAILEADGHSAIEAPDGPQALELVRRSPPDLILLDVMMPGMDGYAVTRALKADAAFRSIPVVLVTALDDNESWRRGMEAGASEFVTKPVDQGRLGLRIRNLLQLKGYSDELVRREEEIRAVLDHMPDAVLRIDARGIVRSANPAVRRILGFAPHELAGQSIARLLPQGERHAPDDFIDRYLSRGDPSAGGEFKGQHQDGRLLDLEVLASEYDSDGDHYFIATFRDISERKRLMTDLKRAREIAQDANRAKSNFLATMSHEIRTPMNSIFGMLELLGLTHLDDEQRATLKVVNGSSRALLRIIDDILDFSKIEAGKLEIRPEVVSIRRLIEDVRNLHVDLASSKGLSVRHSVDTNIGPALRADALRLRQILNNFVSNAIKFTSKGEITIRAALLDRSDGLERLRLTVHDTGIGISEENQQRLFQPFSQGDTDAARNAGGTGLGLTICRRLAEMMGGSVQMESALGKGTTMILTLALPIADAGELPDSAAATPRGLPVAAGSVARAAPTVAQAEAEGTLVLLVDDHPTNRALLMRQLRVLGYAGESAEDGLQALDKWKSGRFGIVIADCNMPLMDGYEMARTIRMLESDRTAETARRTPIIACTASALAGEAERCLTAGMDDYLTKPVELAGLMEKLAKWLPIPKELEMPPVAVEPAAAGAPSSAVAHDPASIAATWGVDEAAMRTILADFRGVNDDDAQVLRRAVDSGDMGEVTRATHRMLGAGKMIGASDFAHICERIERAGRLGERQEIKVEMPAFEAQWTRLNEYIDTLLRPQDV
ncbi:MAG TPA: response regulator [Ramlibacter sp.]|nr:response regulator [Ramlibacter sp.]